MPAENINAFAWDDAYPRPRLRRPHYMLLNGPWDFALTRGEAPARYDRTIMVPYAMEAALSGVGRRHREGDVLWYRHGFVLPRDFSGKRVLLHCGGIDQHGAVYLNGKPVGMLDFLHPTLELTGLPAGENTLVIAVSDNLRDRAWPYGKQKEKRGGMWYTPVTGIWQTVWLEAVPQAYIRDIIAEPRDGGVLLRVAGVKEGVVTLADGAVYPLADGQALITPAQPVYWTPENPRLYDFTLTAGEDSVQSYFALRRIDVRDGRLCLNGAPYFFHGVLDQGYWSDGLYTPPDPAGYERDIRAMKELGFNTLRKHIKVEPELFYYACDRLGMAVFQDMVNNGAYSFLRDTGLPTAGLQTLFTDRFLHRNRRGRAMFLRWMNETVRRLRSHPCVLYWTIFNEGWGQFDSGAVYRRLRQLDDTRIIDSASGWFRGGETDVESRHVYFKPFKMPAARRPVVLSEFGGYGWKLPDHCYSPDKTYGYRNFKDGAAYMDALEALYREQILPAIPQGLNAAIYTQLSDVEDEINGLVTDDRAVCKVDAQRMRGLADEMRAAVRR